MLQNRKNHIAFHQFRLSFGLLLSYALFFSGCQNGPEIIDKTIRGQDTILVEVPVDSTVSRTVNIPDDYLNRCPEAEGFDYPVGPPSAKNYYKFRGFIPKNIEHLGEDWNGTGGGNTDFGDYVYAAGDGVVFAAENHHGGWGNVIRMVHNIGTKEKPIYVETLYAHVASMWGRPGNKLKRGDILGTIGTAAGKYHAHLHFELHLIPGKDIKVGYRGDTAGYRDPTLFIENHRPGWRTPKQ